MNAAEKPPCDHEWEIKDEPVVPDNPKFNYEKVQRWRKKHCMKCGEDRTLDLIVS